MKKTAKDSVREDRIHNEAIMDANGRKSRPAGYSYLDDRIRFPFRPGASLAGSFHRSGKEKPIVHRRVPEDVCSADMLVLIRWYLSCHGSSLVPTHSHRPRRNDLRGHWRLALLGGERLSFLTFQPDSPPLHTLTENSPSDTVPTASRSPAFHLTNLSSFGTSTGLTRWPVAKSSQ